MATQKYQIVTDPRVLRYVPLRGWRAFLHNWFGVPFRRVALCVEHPGCVLVCHPESLAVVRETLDMSSIQYDVKPALRTVEGKT